MEDKQYPGWRRRDVLALGSAGLAAVVVAGPRSTAWSAPLDLPLSAEVNAAEALSVAFVTGGQDQSALGEPSAAGLVDARALPAGDPELAAAGVRLSIHGGFDPSDTSARGLPSLSIDVDFRPFQSSVYHAWGFDHGPLPSMASPVGFTVPVAADTGLSLIVDVGEDRASDPQRHRLRLTTGAEPGLPKLRPGVYLLTWPQLRSAWAGCRWCSRTAGLVRRDWRRDEMVPAGIPHLVLSVERSNAGAA